MHTGLRIAPLVFSWFFGSVNQAEKPKLGYKSLLTAYRLEYTEKHSDPEALGPASPRFQISAEITI